MSNYLLDLIGFSTDNPDDYCDSKTKDKYNFRMLQYIEPKEPYLFRENSPICTELIAKTFYSIVHGGGEREVVIWMFF